MSYDINSITAVGRLTRDPVQKIVGDNLTLSTFSIANSRGKKNGEDVTNFIDVTAFGKTAEFVGQYLKKGSQVAVLGEWKQERWKDNKDGGNRSKISINAKDVQSVGGKANNDNQPLDGNAMTGNIPTGNHDAPDGVPF